MARLDIAKSIFTDCLSQTLFPRTAVVKPRGLSRKHKEQSMFAQWVLSIGRSEYTVILRSASSIAFEYSSDSYEKINPNVWRIETEWIAKCDSCVP